MLKKGQIHVYTGDGKGKTTAAIGLALRAVGQGLKVYVVQFMKGGAYTGEFISSKNFLKNFEVEQYGRPCLKQQKQLKLKSDGENASFDLIRDDIECGDCRYCFLNDDVQKNYVEEAWKKTMSLVNDGYYSLVVLDEINLALSLGFLEIERVVSLIKNRPAGVEVVLTGRDAPLEIKEMADLVTEMKMIKHYFNQGLSARKGIEY